MGRIHYPRFFQSQAIHSTYRQNGFKRFRPFYPLKAQGFDSILEVQMWGVHDTYWSPLGVKKISGTGNRYIPNLNARINQ